MEAALSKYDALMMVQSQTLIGQKSLKENHKDSNKDACVACNRPLVVPRYKGMKSWEQELLSHQPNDATRRPITSPPQRHPEPAVHQTHIIPTATATATATAVLAPVHTASGPQRSNALASSQHLMHAQAKALQLLSSKPADIEMGSVGNGTEIMDLGHYDPPTPLIPSPAEHMMTSLPPVVTVVEAPAVVTKSAIRQPGNTLMPQNLMLDNVPATMSSGSLSPNVGKSRPTSASANIVGSARHKNAIKDAYVLRGGFKMKLSSKGSESVSALISHVNAGSGTGMMQDISRGTLDTTPEHTASYQRTQSLPNASFLQGEEDSP